VKIHQIFIKSIYNTIEFFVSNTLWINVTMNAIKTRLIGTALSIATTAVYADMKPEDAIKYRKAGYNVMSWNMSKIKAMANMGMGALYIAGSEESIGDMKTRAKAEIFTDKDGVKEVAVKFNQAAKRVTINTVKSNHHLPQPSLKPSGGILNTTHG
jgi:hypothetical protein